MSMDLIKLEFETGKDQNLTLLTDQVNQKIQEAKAARGLCILFNPHSTAGLTINSYLDENTGKDLCEEMNRLVPTRVDFHHIYDTPQDASAHIKSSLSGNSLTLIIERGKLLLGSSQGVFFWEFDGPRQRSVYVKIIKE